MVRVTIPQTRTRGRATAGLKARLISGVLLLMPFGITLLVMRWLFNALTAWLRPILKSALIAAQDSPALEATPEWAIGLLVALLSIFVLLALVYLVGAVGQMVLGKRLIALGEALLLKIPLARSIYSATKQVVQATSLSDRSGFHAVVLVEFPRPGAYAMGFSTGQVRTPKGELLEKVFIPTAPNPTTGFFEILSGESVTHLDMSVEDAFKTIISAGLVGFDVLPVKKDA